MPLYDPDSHGLLLHFADVSEARSLGHPPSLAGSLQLYALLLSLLGYHAALDDQANELAALADEYGFPYWRSNGAIYPKSGS